MLIEQIMLYNMLWKCVGIGTVFKEMLKLLVAYDKIISISSKPMPITFGKIM
jgi:hypothetical protein